LSFPHALRYRLAYDPKLVTGALDVFIKTVFGSLIRRAEEFGAVCKAQCGAVSFIQRFGSGANLNVHIWSSPFRSFAWRDIFPIRRSSLVVESNRQSVEPSAARIVDPV
jgi:hypothetical protein